MDQVTSAEALREKIKSEFGSVVQATPENDDYTFDAVVNRVWEDEDGSVYVRIFADQSKSFDLQVTEIDKQETQWVLFTGSGKWGFRALEPDRAKRFLKFMKEAGVNG